MTLQETFLQKLEELRQENKDLATEAEQAKHQARQLVENTIGLAFHKVLEDLEYDLQGLGLNLSRDSQADLSLETLAKLGSIRYAAEALTGFVEIISRDISVISYEKRLEGVLHVIDTVEKNASEKLAKSV